jgi:mono/diheme cytochrome c family protein
MVRYLVSVLGLSFICLGAWAQAPSKPGPMQSGTHVPPAAPADKAAPSGQQSATAPSSAAQFDVNQLFASSCGWCHLNGGRQAGKGPKLMGTELSDSEIISRIKVGKPGQMPGFGTTFNDDQMKAIVAYIRELK